MDDNKENKPQNNAGQPGNNAQNGNRPPRQSKPYKPYRRPKKPFTPRPAADKPAEIREMLPEQPDVSAAEDNAEKVAPATAAAPEAPAAPAAPDVEIIGIKFRSGGKVYYFGPNGISFEAGDHAIVETVRGVEYGNVTIGNKYVPASEIIGTLKNVIRKADDNDARRDEQNRALEESARPIWDEAVKRNKLVMQLVDIEYTFDNAKLIFYFTADGRVDFRELVKDLASIFRTRIELRQIGVRDEAKLIGGLGVCGRPFCCKTFLSDFAQVSIKMAKEQNLSLSSTKISGTCGRLMCCLRFEQDTYEKEYASFPKVDSIVDTPAGRGVITESSFLTGVIKVKMDGDQNAPVKLFGKSDVKVVGHIRSNVQVDESLLKLEDQ